MEDKRRTGTDVANDVSVQIGLVISQAHQAVSEWTYHDHDVKLLGLRDKLHRGVVDNHRVESDTSVSVLLLGNSLTRVEEETVSKLHDVGLVDTGDFLPGQRASRTQRRVCSAKDPPFGCS